MKTIGFIDYFIDEWHANNYPKMISDLTSNYVVKYAWAEIDNPDGLTTDEWCAKNGCEKCSSIEEVCKKADYIIILAPSNPEKHLEYVEKAFVSGKTTYVDKTFAPDYETAVKIFDCANKYGVKFFSSSALRYASALEKYTGKGECALILGGGGNFDEYCIHLIEMAVKLLGVGTTKVKYEKFAEQEWAELYYEDGRHAKLMFSPFMPYAVAVSQKGENIGYETLDYSFFDNLVKDIVRFFDTGVTSFDGRETLEVMKIRGAVIKAKQTAGEIIEV